MDRSGWIPWVADANALLGWMGWLVLWATNALGPIREIVALALLVLVPLGLRLADTPRRNGTRSRWYLAAVLGQPIAAVPAVYALSLPSGTAATLLVIPWLAVALAAAAFGAWRLLQRGPWPISEAALDFALLYLVVGAGALVLDRLGVALFFEPIIVTLTIVHFHYAGFALPVTAGLAGRLAPRDRFDRLRRATIAIIAIGPGIIAVGITFSALGTTVGRLVEVLAVGFFTTAVALFSLTVVVGVVPRMDGRVQRLFVTVASLTVTATMAVAVLYGVARFTGGRYVGIDATAFGRMVRWHGQYNAYGFGLLALLGWRLEAPESAARPPGIEFSRLTSGWRVGPGFLERNALDDPDETTGMVDSLDRFLDGAAIHPDVRWLYEQSAETVLEVDPDWAPIPKPLAPLYRRLAGRLGQLSIPTEPLTGEQALTSRVVGVDDAADGREGVRAWIRSNDWDGTGDPAMTYVAAYTDYEGMGGTFSGMAFPLPYCNLSAILRVEPLGDAGGQDGSAGVLLSSYPTPENSDDAGLYLVVRGFGIRLPLNERLRAWSPKTEDAPASPFAADGDSPADDATDRLVFVRHDVSLLRWRLFTIHYRITAE